MSTTTNPAADSPEASTEYKYVVVGTGNPFDCETRHEAVGKLARYDTAERIVPIAESCLVRYNRYPEHLGNKHYSDRQTYATTHGTTQIDRVDVVRMVNGNQQDTLESHWTVDCPVCRRTFESDDAAEDARLPLLDEMHACCGTEWFPPSDWVDDCEICGDSHRGKYNCTALAWRDGFDGLEGDESCSCAKCGWDGSGEGLLGPRGECPECESRAVRVVE